MGNELNELKDYVNEEGRDINVIEKQLPVKVGTGSLIFEIILWDFYNSRNHFYFYLWK